MLRYFLESHGVQRDKYIESCKKSNMEEMLTVDVFQSTHAHARRTHTRTHPARLAAICKNVIAT